MSELIVTVLEGKGLGGTGKARKVVRDPMLVLQVGAVKRNTKVKFKAGDHPEWKQVFTFKNIREETKIWVQLYDGANPTRERLVGELRATLGELILYQTEAGIWLQLTDTLSSTRPRGQVLLQLETSVAVTAESHAAAAATVAAAANRTRPPRSPSESPPPSRMSPHPRHSSPSRPGSRPSSRPTPMRLQKPPVVTPLEVTPPTPTTENGFGEEDEHEDAVPALLVQPPTAPRPGTAPSPEPVVDGALLSPHTRPSDSVTVDSETDAGAQEQQYLDVPPAAEGYQQPQAEPAPEALPAEQPASTVPPPLPPLPPMVDYAATPVPVPSRIQRPVSANFTGVQMPWFPSTPPGTSSGAAAPASPPATDSLGRRRYSLGDALHSNLGVPGASQPGPTSPYYSPIMMPMPMPVATGNPETDAYGAAYGMPLPIPGSIQMPVPVAPGDGPVAVSPPVRPLPVYSQAAPSPMVNAGVPSPMVKGYPPQPAPGYAYAPQPAPYAAAPAYGSPTAYATGYGTPAMYNQPAYFQSHPAAPAMSPMLLGQGAQPASTAPTGRVLGPGALPTTATTTTAPPVYAGPLHYPYACPGTVLPAAVASSGSTAVATHALVGTHSTGPATVESPVQWAAAYNIPVPPIPNDDPQASEAAHRPNTLPHAPGHYYASSNYLNSKPLPYAPTSGAGHG
ncbi:hypothetical protein GGF31_007102 [Allomyces arbusculus]|nr:hypothetical protein GGF31_007102 [Allomyces arbusculus]